MRTNVKIFFMFFLTAMIIALLTAILQGAYVTTDARIFILSMIISSSLLSIAMLLFITRSISRPIEKITAGVEEISKGNFDADIDRELKDEESEIGDLARAFERIVTSFKLAVNLAGVGKDKLRLGELIEERKKTEQRLHTTEELLDHFIENAGMPIIAFDKKGELMLANRKFTEITGYKKEEVANQDRFMGLAFPAKLASDKFIKAVAQFNKGDEVTDFVIPLRCKNGATIIAMSNFTGIKNDGKTEGVAIFMRDLSEVFKLEKEIRFWAANGFTQERDQLKKSKIEMSDIAGSKKKVR